MVKEGGRREEATPAPVSFEYFPAARQRARVSSSHKPLNFGSFLVIIIIVVVSCCFGWWLAVESRKMKEEVREGREKRRTLGF